MPRSAPPPTRPAEDRPPAALRSPPSPLLSLLAVLAVLPLSPRGAAAQVDVRSARPNPVVLQTDARRPTTVVLSGRGLEDVTSAQVSVRGRAVRGVRAQIRYRRGSLQVSLLASESSPAVKADLVLTLRNRRRVTLDDVTVVIERPAPPTPGVAGLTISPNRVAPGDDVRIQVILDRAATGRGLTVDLRSASRSLPLPARIRVSPGARRGETSFRVPTGARSKRVTVVASTSEGRAATELVVEARPAFAPRSLTTSGLALVGIRFTPVEVGTSSLALTGVRFDPLTLATGELRLTGVRFVPSVVNTSPLRLTGTRSTR